MHADMHNILRQSEISLYWVEAIYNPLYKVKAKDQSKSKFTEKLKWMLQLSHPENERLMQTFLLWIW